MPKGLSMLVDSTLWRQPWLWPEAYTIIFNVIEGKASEWGVRAFSFSRSSTPELTRVLSHQTSPWNFYILNLPLLLLSALPLLAVTLSRRALRRETAGMTVPAFAMIAGLSKLAHKEWRFIYYAVVWLNAAAAVGGAWMCVLSLSRSLVSDADPYHCSWTTRSKSRARTLAAIVLVPLGLLGNIAVTTSLTLISGHNYPGGELMSILHRVEPASANGEGWPPSFSFSQTTDRLIFRPNQSISIPPHTPFRPAPLSSPTSTALFLRPPSQSTRRYRQTAASGSTPRLSSLLPRYLPPRSRRKRAGRTSYSKTRMPRLGSREDGR